MSNLQLNRRKPIRLPFSTALKSTHLNQVEQTDCGICRRNKSKYVCPRCNIFYCSLECFRSTQHVQCSEPFYAASIRESIAQNPSSSEEEKKGMFKILERFERGAGDDRGKGETDDAGEESLEVVGNGIGAGKLEDLYRGLIGEGEGEDENDQDDEEDEEEREELVRRLEGVDLDSLAPQDLFALLPASHRKEFVAALQSEQSRARLVQDAEKDDDKDQDDDGEDVEGEGEVVGWWAPTGMALRLEEDDTDDAGTEVVKGKPELLDEVSLGKITIPPTVVEGLRFNLLTICLAYIILIETHLPRTRTIQKLLSSESESTGRKKRKVDELEAMLRGMAEFLFDSKSAWKARGMRDVEDAVRGGVDEDEVVDYLQDLADLIRPPLDMTEIHPAQLALSDLHALFSFESDRRNKNKQVLKKLEFYYTLAGLIKRSGWIELERAIQARKDRLQADQDAERAGDEKTQPLLVEDDVPVRRIGVAEETGDTGGKIVEL